MGDGRGAGKALVRRGRFPHEHTSLFHSRSLRRPMISYSKKILFVGYGAVAECTLPILLKHIKVPARNITVMDFEDKADKLAQWTALGVHFVRDRVTEGNMARLLAKHVGAGDLLIDLAWNIDACEILQWCHDHGVLYINTSTELWDPYAGGPNTPPAKR